MANRYFNQFQYTYEKDTVTIFGSVTIGASGAVASKAGGGVLSVTKSATAGQYVITFNDQFSRLLETEFNVVHSAISAVATVQVLQAAATLQADVISTKTLTIQCVDVAGAAVNPEATAAVFFKVVFRRSSVSSFGF